MLDILCESVLYIAFMKATPKARIKNGLNTAVMVRMEKQLRAELEMRADQTHRKLAQLIRLVLWEYVGKAAR